ncbi:MAG: hypothetical protein WB609_08895 [Candidatus Cybelea sp.]
MRHLFRHLDDVKELKRNPLVQQSGLGVIRARIQAGAKDYCDAAGPEERVRVQRRLAILNGCLQGRSVKEVATQLEMSLRQCYRERSLIHRYVAEFLRRDDFKSVEPVAHIESAFEIQMERAAARAANGDYLPAMRKYKSLIDQGSVCQKLRALIGRAELELELGDLRSAESSVAALSTCSAQADDLPMVENNESGVYQQLLSARLAWETGSFGEALRKLSLARSAAAEFRAAPADCLRALYADITIESANRAFDLGDFEATKAFLAIARESSDTLSGPAQRTANVLLMESTLSFVSVRPGEDIPLHDPIALASRAHSVALQCGSIKWRLRAEMFLTALQRATVNVMQRGELILSLAKSLHNPRLFAMLSLELADMLLETPSWREADRLMRVTLPRESFYAGSFSMLKAVYQLKARAAPAAKRHAQVAHAVARRAAAPRFQASTLRLLGCSSYMLGEREQAADYIISAVSLAEQYGSAPARLKTFRTAALITGKRKYAREAERLASAIQ